MLKVSSFVIAMMLASPGQTVSADTLNAEISFVVKRTKSNDKGWDALGGAPDPVICVFHDNSKRGHCISSNKGVRKAKKHSVYLGTLSTQLIGAGSCYNRYACTFHNVKISTGKTHIFVYDQDTGKSDMIARLLCVAGGDCTYSKNHRLESFKVFEDPPKNTDLHFISFCSRPSPNKIQWPGHAFVAFTVRDSHKNIRNFYAFGATVPENSGIGSAIISNGRIAQEDFKLNLERGLKSNCLHRIVSYKTFEDAWLTALPRTGDINREPWLYLGVGHNCVSYAKKIAERIGLKSNSNKTPDSFIRQLQKDNVP